MNVRQKWNVAEICRQTEHVSVNIHRAAAGGGYGHCPDICKVFGSQYGRIDRIEEGLCGRLVIVLARRCIIYLFFVTFEFGFAWYFIFICVCCTDCALQRCTDFPLKFLFCWWILFHLFCCWFHACMAVSRLCNGYFVTFCHSAFIHWCVIKSIGNLRCLACLNWIQHRWCCWLHINKNEFPLVMRCRCLLYNMQLVKKFGYFSANDWALVAFCFFIRLSSVHQWYWPTYRRIFVWVHTIHCNVAYWMCVYAKSRKCLFGGNRSQCIFLDNFFFASIFGLLWDAAAAMLATQMTSNG